jgi:hypothetical protein
MSQYCTHSREIVKKFFRLKKPPGFLGVKGFFTVFGGVRAGATSGDAFRQKPSQVNPFDGDTK